MLRPRRHVPLVLCALLGLLAPSAALAQTDPPPQGWLGVSLADAPVDPAAEPLLDPSAARVGGAVVVGVVKDSPADRAGLRAGDRVIAVDEAPIEGAAALVRAVQGYQPGSGIRVTIVRDDDERDLSLRLAERPRSRDAMRLKRGWIGLTPIDVPLALREYWGGSEERGVLVGEVEEGSPAYRGGLRPGDLVLAVDGEDTGTARDLMQRVLRGGVDNVLDLEISRQGSFFTAEVLVEEAPEDEDEDERRSPARRR
jgi:serine protease Do